MMKSEIDARRSKVCNLMQQAGVQNLLIGPGADFAYLSGLQLQQSDRLTLLVLQDDGTTRLLAPSLEQAAISRDSTPEDFSDVIFWDDAQDPFDLLGNVIKTRSSLAVNGQLWSRSLLRIQERLKPQQIATSDQMIGKARILKSAFEIAELTTAAEAIGAVHQQIPALLKIGRSEHEVADDIRNLMRETGHERAEFVIVAVGPGGAEPHHEPGAAAIQPGQPIVIDIGGPIKSGYFSDMTRMYCVGEPSVAALNAIQAVQAAQELAVQSVSPGVMASTIDKVARDALSKAGMAEYFIHRVGHGIGLEVHEPPWLGAKDDVELASGMVFSVEPGVYRPGEYGVRIEDIVLVTASGVSRLNQTPRDLKIIE